MKLFLAWLQIGISVFAFSVFASMSYLPFVLGLVCIVALFLRQDIVAALCGLALVCVWLAPHAANPTGVTVLAICVGGCGLALMRPRLG